MADPKELPKHYDHSSIEKKWDEAWKKNAYFRASTDSNKPTFAMVIPPPNITGVLHMGHALNNTLQDMIARYKRMQGNETLWMPGTDHAGIATQNVVEKALAKKGVHRKNLGREKFVDEVWKWREQYGSTIVHQLERMGCSCDWEKLRFTMDEGLSEAVKQVFIRLFDKGLIYRSYYIINWCPRCQTALSDEEVLHEDLDGGMYHIQYGIKDSDESVIIATTRPETLLGDTAIGFNPKDKRYQSIKGKLALLPLLGRELTIVQDEDIDAEFGTGALKITPAHDPVDFELGRKHDLEYINILNPDGTLNDNAGPYKGLDRFDARKRILKDLESKGLLIKKENHKHAVGHCYRCNTIIEPYCSNQWFVKMKELAKPAIEAYKNKDIRFHPDRWGKVYMDWMDNIRDWCISRQIWWGHRIPVYYTDDGQYTAAESVEDARKKLQLNSDTPLHQDEDVLDTWFSSWLWPFSTLGWPKETDLLKKFYPTQTLVTGYEIIFFWVARMIMAGFEFMGKQPFSDIYIHGIVRDQTGQKMSKSKGNVVDPLEVIEEFGADALRYSIVSITSEGQDVYASKERCEIGRNFATKIWNASRFVLMNLDGRNPSPEQDISIWKPHDKWIMSRLHQTIKGMGESFDRYRFNEATSQIYNFFWGEYCDWYLELAKPHVENPTTQWVLLNVLEASLKLLHPIMPFVTEEIWDSFPKSLDDKQHLIVSSWPKAETKWVDDAIENEMNIVIHQIYSLRKVRSSWKVPPKEWVSVYSRIKTEKDKLLIDKYASDIKSMARVKEYHYGKELERPKQSAIATTGNIESYIPLGSMIDVNKEMESLKKELNQMQKLSGGIERKLTNEKFIQNAPQNVIDKEKKKLTDYKDRIVSLQDNLKTLEL